MCRSVKRGWSRGWRGNESGLGLGLRNTILRGITLIPLDVANICGQLFFIMWFNPNKRKIPISTWRKFCAEFKVLRDDVFLPE